LTSIPVSSGLGWISNARPVSARPTANGCRMTTRSTRVEVGDRELSISNLDKVLFPESGFTKGELIDYYVHIAPVMLPHLQDRPLTMKRYPDGVTKKFFYEKHSPSHAPDWVRTVGVPTAEGDDTIVYSVIGDLPSLVWAANLGTIEFHVPLWHVGRRRALPAAPDHIVFDLDPGEGTSVVECCEVALLVDKILKDKNLTSRAKTSGSKGLQVYATPKGRLTWDSARTTARGIAEELSSEHPELVTANMRKALRRGKVLIDWSQNRPAKTTVCAYSVRGVTRPTVSTPVRWKEIRDCQKSGDPTDLEFTATEALSRVKDSGDLFA
jgi:bifunctional non-homologous end joining protein LigD